MRWPRRVCAARTILYTKGGHWTFSAGANQLCTAVESGQCCEPAMGPISAPPQVGFEPTGDEGFSRCARSQRNYRCVTARTVATARRDKRPFRQGAAVFPSRMSNEVAREPLHLHRVRSCILWSGPSWRKTGPFSCLYLFWRQQSPAGTMLMDV